MIGYVQSDGKWLIALNPRLAPSGGNPSRAYIQTWDGCWNGQDWVPQDALAMKFDSREEAQKYYLMHKARIDRPC
jgi:hypothetical protein